MSIKTSLYNSIVDYAAIYYYNVNVLHKQENLLTSPENLEDRKKITDIVRGIYNKKSVISTPIKKPTKKTTTKTSTLKSPKKNLSYHVTPIDFSPIAKLNEKALEFLSLGLYINNPKLTNIIREKIYIAPITLDTDEKLVLLTYYTGTTYYVLQALLKSKKAKLELLYSEDGLMQNEKLEKLTNSYNVSSLVIPTNVLREKLMHSLF
jgi:hypothetical protein